MMELNLLLKYAATITAILFVIPWLLGNSLMFLTGFYLKCYKNYYLQPGQETDYKFWEKARWTVAKFWVTFARLWYGYEIVGLENLPEEPSLIVAFHGAMPADCHFFMHSIYLKTKRQFCGVTDRFVMKFPMYRYFSECFKMYPSNLESCIEIIRSGETLVILPGGAYEGHISQNYQLKWRNRLGFAKVALAAKVNIVPIFTSNIQEAHRTVGICMGFWEKFYLKTRLPLVPMYGGFPVKLTSYIGKPVVVEEGMTPEEVKQIVMNRLEEMIRRHQRLPGNILLAIKDRFF